MKSLHRVLLGLGILLTAGHSADAQTTRAKGRKAPPATGTATPSAPGFAARPAVQRPTYAATTGFPQPPSAYLGAGTVAPVYNPRTTPYADNTFQYLFAPNFFTPNYDPAFQSFYDSQWFYADVQATYPVLPRYSEPPSTEATIEVLLPRSDAVLLVNGNKTASNGLRRRFTSPALDPGRYSYHLTAAWTTAGKDVHMERTIRVAPGGSYFVDFNKIDPETLVSK